MSSTQRGAERAADDTYFTRYPCALAICEKLRDDGILPEGKEGGLRVLEPSCGKGAFVTALKDTSPSASVHALDINTKLLLPEHAANADRVITSDFLAYRPRVAYDLIIGNPPYSHAEQHVRHAVELTRDGDDRAVVAFLLRLNFLAGIERHGWSKAAKMYVNGAFYDLYAPEAVYPLDKRPPFLEGKNTDSCEYGVFVWRGRPSEYETIMRPLRWRNYLNDWELRVEKAVKVAKAKESGKGKGRRAKAKRATS